jgi:hypothetical protein
MFWAMAVTDAVVSSAVLTTSRAMGPRETFELGRNVSPANQEERPDGAPRREVTREGLSLLRLASPVLEREQTTAFPTPLLAKARAKCTKTKRRFSPHFS